MKILNFDTSLEKTYITLSNDDNEIISEIIENQQGRYHSAFLLPTLAKILREANLQMKDLDYIATNIGPGSFTGIRAGLTVARTICQQTDVKALGVSSLEILSKINADKSKTLVALDARKNAMYVEIFDEYGNVIKYPCAIQTEDVIRLVKEDDYFVITDDKMSNVFEENDIVSVNYKLENYDLGKFLNNIVKDFIQNNPDYDYNWARLKPLYIQPPPVTISKANSGGK